MVYAMSDIHGYYGKYKAMLKEINFNENDQLFIIGDVIDRGPEGIEIIKDIMSHDNITLLMGNHEHMFLSFMEQNQCYCSPYNHSYMTYLWYRNGGLETHEAYKKESKESKEAIYNFIKSLPYDANITVNNQKFRLVHAYPGTKDEGEFPGEIMIWERPMMFCPPKVDDDLFVIIGHTPTAKFCGDKNHFEVIKFGPNIWDIDCGMASDNIKKRRLACIRLDDKKIFYK